MVWPSLGQSVTDVTMNFKSHQSILKIYLYKGLKWIIDKLGYGSICSFQLACGLIFSYDRCVCQVLTVKMRKQIWWSTVMKSVHDLVVGDHCSRCKSSWGPEAKSPTSPFIMLCRGCIKRCHSHRTFTDECQMYCCIYIMLFSITGIYTRPNWIIRGGGSMHCCTSRANVKELFLQNTAVVPRDPVATPPVFKCVSNLKQITL